MSDHDQQFLIKMDGNQTPMVLLKVGYAAENVFLNAMQGTTHTYFHASFLRYVYIYIWSERAMLIRW